MRASRGAEGLGHDTTTDNNRTNISFGIGCNK